MTKTTNYIIELLDYHTMTYLTMGTYLEQMTNDESLGLYVKHNTALKTITRIKEGRKLNDSTYR